MKYMSTKEAAEKWGVSQSTVAKWCREDKIIFIAKPEKIGREWKIPTEAPMPTKKKTKN